jgi:hypothetical protein
LVSELGAHPLPLNKTDNIGSGQHLKFSDSSFEDAERSLKQNMTPLC